MLVTAGAVVAVVLMRGDDSPADEPDVGNSTGATPAPSFSLPVELPSGLPTELPSRLPTRLPSRLPTALPSDLPSDLESLLPSLEELLP
ncbi:hypothetical protein ASD48_23335 [Streptomyces sp. Root1310]|nr:hypothetical protein ASD48_23335 [Streptomyces sp. Root1310]